MLSPPGPPNGLVLLKTYGLFSFMFGVGLGFLMRSAARRGLPFGRIYLNRMTGLAILGIAHGCLFFPGDILTIYAVTGLTVAAAPVATLGYLGLIAALSRPPGPILAKALSTGGSSLSVYLGQSIMLSTIFSGYGLGLWNSVDHLAAIVAGVAVTSPGTGPLSRRQDGPIGSTMVCRAG
jgi:uncharacterized membrane protein YeiB